MRQSAMHEQYGGDEPERHADDMHDGIRRTLGFGIDGKEKFDVHGTGSELRQPVSQKAASNTVARVKISNSLG